MLQLAGHCFGQEWGTSIIIKASANSLFYKNIAFYDMEIQKPSQL
jgi:hypothetical protein